MKKILALIAISLCISACGHVQATGYAKPGATVQEYQTDRYQCIKDAQWVQNRQDIFDDLHSDKVTDCGQFASCMESKGYTVEFNGPFHPRNFTNCDPNGQFVQD